MRTLWQIIAGIFRWTWRLLNFIRELILNLFPVLLIPVGVGIYLSFQSSSTSTARARRAAGRLKRRGGRSAFGK